MSRMNGPSQRIRQTQLSSIRGSLPWMAIELFKLGEVTYTKETDIWAFGMTVYVSLSEDLAVLRIISNRLTQNWQELITRKRPYENVNNILALISTIGHGVKPSAPERLELATTDRRILWKVCNVSWSNEPADSWVDEVFCLHEPYEQIYDHKRQSPLNLWKEFLNLEVPFSLLPLTGLVIFGSVTGMPSDDLGRAG